MYAQFIDDEDGNESYRSKRVIPLALIQMATGLVNFCLKICDRINEYVTSLGPVGETHPK